VITRAIATRYDRRAEAGRNNPLRVTVETLDGEEHEVFLKASGAPELSVPGLAAEALAACIAGQLGLPVCRPFLVEILPDWVATVSDAGAQDVLTRSSPVAFGSGAAGPGWRPWSSEDAITTGRRQSALEILVFDAFVENPDRKPSNPNLLVKGDAFRIIDHELALRVTGIFPRPEPWRVGYLNLLAHPDGHVFHGRIRAADVRLDSVREAWLRISDDCLADFEAALPMEWNEATPMVEAALSHVRMVRDRIDECLTEIGRILE
jgi:hypothetical protein